MLCPITVCPVMHFGQTFGDSHKRNKDAVKHAKTEVTTIAEHVWNEDHQVNYQRTSILALEQDTCTS